MNLISCGCSLLFTSRCEHGSDGVSIWSNLDCHTYERYPVMCRSRYESFHCNVL